MQQVVRAAGRRWMTLDDAPLADLEELHTFSRRSEPYKVFTPFYRIWHPLCRATIPLRARQHCSSLIR
ncbi:hypothetical protein [Paenibacillus sp. Leaf72]|uniref:hypothetical protein n=1 Tax=Paenibacillus sp. Leaf72 TaxID=1736234 RepID=UPI0009D6F809|nr:hypothetical protein [Paenibacillus sp. Leaf72]